MIETVLALGVEDQLVGTSFAGHGLDPSGVKAEYQDEYARIPVLSGTELSKEVLLSVSPDFVVGRNSTFDEAKGLSRDALAAEGINTFVLSEDCVDGPPTWPALYEQITVLGQIFDARDRAEQVIADMQADVETVTAQIETLTSDPPRVFTYQMGETAPDTTGQGTLNLAIETAGGENIFGDIPEFYATVTWEEVVARDPEVIIIVDRTGGQGGSEEASVASKRAFLLSFPPLAEVTAIQNDQIFSVPLSQVYMSERNSDLALTIAETIHADLF